MRAKDRVRRASGNEAFTLVELLVVIAIILLLAGILVPTVSSALSMGHKAACKARINELNDGCHQYKIDSKYYPGQKTTDWTTFSLATGAQVLARAMFTKETGEWPTSNYASYKASDLLAENPDTGRNNTIEDRFPREKQPILYYPSRVNESGLSQYKVADNQNITGAWGNFNTFITDGGFGSAMARNSGEFLLIGAGVDREFVTNDTDNLVNWNK